MSAFSCEAVARAFRGEPAKKVGAELYYHHGADGHVDRNPSVKINTIKDVWIDGPCGKGGNAWELAAFFIGCDPNDKKTVTAALRECGLLNGASGNSTRGTASAGAFREVAKFSYGSNLRKIRLERPASNGAKPEKTFRWEHQDGDAWLPGDGGLPKPLYTNRIFSERDQLGLVLACEGEAKADLAGELGFPAFCFKDLTPAQCATLAGLDIVLWPDKDQSGAQQSHKAAMILHDSKQPRLIRVITPPAELPESGDIIDAVRSLGWGRAEIDNLIRDAQEWKSQAVPSGGSRISVNPWSLAVGMDVFLGDEEEPVKFLFAPVIAKEAVTEIFSPRGLGKSLWALFVAVYLAMAGYKVLLIDRDNPRRVVRERLRFFGATSDLTTLKVLSRENAPPLTNTRAWAEFPYYEYDLVILDSLDSAAEGVGEQDSTKPSLAIAPLLDIARRENGPAVLLLGNTIKSAKHSRGSGVIEDRADIVFEVRDATNFHPTGKKPWIEELPAADAGSWTGRSTRRKRLSKYRLAFIATKFRIGEEPEPFIVEIDLTTEPWTVRDVTDDVDREGAAARAQAAEERAAAVQTATESLKVEILRREAAGEPVLLKKQAEDFLVSARQHPECCTRSYKVTRF